MPAVVPFDQALPPQQPVVAYTFGSSYVPAPFDIPHWNLIGGTQTVFLARKPAPEELKRMSSFTRDAPPMEFCFINNDVLAGFERLCAFKTWDDNWDAEGSRAPQAAVLDAATKVYSLLAPHALPSVHLSPDGHPLFVYDGEVKGEVMVTSASTLDFFFTDHGPADEDVAFDGSALPDVLLTYLSSHA